MLRVDVIAAVLVVLASRSHAQEEDRSQSAPRPPATRGSLEFLKWSGRVNVPDPVAIALDRQGRAYVTQTMRRKSQDLDIRANPDWIPFDVGFRTVDDKRNFYHERLAPDRDDPSKARRVEDLNGDGSHDWRDLTVFSERIHRVEDGDGDGTADTSRLFAEGFRTEVTGIAAGVLWVDNPDAPHGDVYATIAPDVWRLRDTDGDGTADEREVIATGFGLHIAYAGHDMHGLTVGPDGRIYWTVGDKGISVVSQEGREFRFPNEGGVLRCNPDGSGFEVFAHGLRNVQEIAFDEFGNLFGVDNDADQPGERERFVYIAKGIDAGWRCNYQYRGDDWNPWTDEKLWVPHFDGQAAYVTPPIAHSIDGPAGFAFEPGTALNPGYRGYFFLTGAPGGTQIAFRAEPSGASFRMVDEHEIGSGLPLVGINFGPDGALYAVDWGGGYPLNEKGAIWRIDDPAFADSEARQETRELLRTGVDSATDAEQLLLRLDHADQRVRLDAQFELVRRDEAVPLLEVAKRGPRMARIHAIWGLGQLVRSGRIDGADLVRLLGDGDPEIRAQAARVGGDFPEFDGRLLIPLLADESPRVRSLAAIALGDHPVPEAREAIVRLLAENDGRDVYLRHAGIVALAACGGAAELVDHESEAVRLAAVVALRRTADVAAARFLNDASPHVVAEAARAIHDDLSIVPALPALANVLDADTGHAEPTTRRAVNAAFRLGGDENALRIARFAADERRLLDLRLDALDALREWIEPPVLDRVDGRNRHAEYGDRALPLDRLSPLLSAPLRSENARLRTAALATARTVGVPVDEAALAEIVASPDGADALRVEALAVLAAQESERLPRAVDVALAANSAAVRTAGLARLAAIEPDAALRRASRVYQTSNDLRERQGAVGIVASIGTVPADAWIGLEFARLRNRRTDAAVELEIIEAMRSRAAEVQTFARELAEFDAQRAEAAATDPLAPFSESLEGGDPAVGRSIFATNVTAQCIRCHRVGEEGSNVGPPLDDVATRRDKQYLLRSIVAPSADIDPKYRTQVLLLSSGKTAQGLLRERTADETVLFDAKGNELRFPNDEIEETIEQTVSIMPEIVKELSRREVRDLVAYLRTLRKR